MKTCKTCKQRLPPTTEYFYACNTGLDPMCKVCRQAFYKAKGKGTYKTVNHAFRLNKKELAIVQRAVELGAPDIMNIANELIIGRNR